MTCKPPNPYGQSDPVSAPQPPADLKTRMKDTYNAIADTYNAWSTAHFAARFRYTAELLQTIRERRQAIYGLDDYGAVSLAGMKALELGCGRGVPVLEMLLREGMEVVGVDLSGAQLEMARGELGGEVERGRLKLVEGDMMGLEYGEAEFDVVLSLYTLHHLPTGEQREMLVRVQRWLKPGGMILMNFPIEELKGEVIKKWLGQEEGWIYSAAFGEEKTLEMLKELGFNVIFQEVEGDPTSDAEFLWVVADKASSELKEVSTTSSPKSSEKASDDGSQKGDKADSKEGSEAGSKANSKEGSPA